MIENRINISQTFGNRLDPHQFHYERMEVINQIYGTNEWAKLKNAVRSVKTITKEFSEDDIYIGLENIISNTGEYYPTSDKESISSAAVFKKGDILFPKLRPYLNKVYRADFDGKCSTEFHVFQAKGIDPDYLTIILRSSLIVNQTKHLMTGNTLPRLQTSDIEDLIIPTPSKEVQQRIVDIYSKASEQKRAKEQETQTLLDSIDSYLLGELGITLPETQQRQLAFKVNISEMLGNRYNVNSYSSNIRTIITAISKSKYSLSQLNELSGFQPGFAFKSDSYVTESNCCLITIKNIDKNRVSTIDSTQLPTDFYDKYERFQITEDDLLIAMTGATIGKVGLYRSNERALLNQRVGMFKPKIINRLYLMNLLNTDICQAIILNKAGGGAQPNISESEIMSISIPNPPLAKQNEIAETISTIRAKASALQAEASAQLSTAKQQIEKIILG